jgi:hypothetical protein
VPHSGSDEIEDWLPPDLAEVERQLADRARPDPPGELRRRVLDGVRGELAKSDARGMRWQISWRLVGSVAAGIFLCLNLALALESRKSAGPGVDGRRAAEVAAELRRLDPDLPEGEARRLALASQLASRLVAAPDRGVPSEAAVRALRSESWDTP